MPEAYQVTAGPQVGLKMRCRGAKHWAASLMRGTLALIWRDWPGGDFTFNDVHVIVPIFNQSLDYTLTQLLSNDPIVHSMRLTPQTKQ